MKDNGINAELLKFGTYNTEGVAEEFLERMIPIAIFVWKGKLVAIEWFVEGYGNFIDDENIASIAHRINLQTYLELFSEISS